MNIRKDNKKGTEKYKNWYWKEKHKKGSEKTNPIYKKESLYSFYYTFSLLVFEKKSTREKKKDKKWI